MGTGEGKGGEWESGRVGEWESRRVGEPESGRAGEWESRRVGEGDNSSTLSSELAINLHNRRRGSLIPFL
jgi:hypothetical protein